MLTLIGKDIVPNDMARILESFPIQLLQSATNVV
jgi:hypothetical protein